MTHASLLNTGVIGWSRHAENRSDDALGPRTFIVTGIARSGTSMVAGMLRDAGVFMGHVLHEVVDEDAAILEALHAHDISMLHAIIEARDAEYPQWGFKVPDLHARLPRGELGSFRNPHLIVIWRDPVAIAARNAISEHFPELDSLANAASATLAMARFVMRAPCPVYLMSYEKTLAFPAVVIDGLLKFCGLEADSTARARMSLRVQPNRQEYLLAARRRFKGAIDGILDGYLYGWCAQEDWPEPVRLELYVDETLTCTFLADNYRPDLARLGIGSGNHAFFIDIEKLGIPPDSIVKVKIADRVIELDNSGRRFSTLPVVVNQDRTSAARH